MVIAKTTIETAGKTFHAGETVTGLSGADIRRMSEAGYIEVTEEEPSAPAEEAIEEAAGKTTGADKWQQDSEEKPRKRSQKK